MLLTTIQRARAEASYWKAIAYTQTGEKITVDIFTDGNAFYLGCDKTESKICIDNGLTLIETV